MPSNNKINNMCLEELEIERLNVREQILTTNSGRRKNDLNKYLAKLNDRVGQLRKLRASN